MGARCREGHASDELDYCSVCGAAMPAQAPAKTAASAASAASAVAGAASACPECGEPRADAHARFCEVCRFDFVARKPGPPPVARTPVAAPAPPAPVASAPVNAPSPAVSAAAWSVVVCVDPALDVEPDPESPCPVNAPEQVIAVRAPELLVGRHDDRRDIHPEISVRDPGASRRHAKIVLLADGSLALQDLASMNGTKLNGADVEPGSRRALTAGDEVTLGRWTRIRVRRT
jgi:hypothetical protein